MSFLSLGSSLISLIVGSKYLLDGEIGNGVFGIALGITALFAFFYFESEKLWQNKQIDAVFKESENKSSTHQRGKNVRN